MRNKFRLYLLSLSLLVGLAVPSISAAQSSINNIDSVSINSRITQLERISDAHSQLLIKFQQQLADNQRSIDLLYGQIQENQYHLSQIAERQKKIYQQMNSFFNQEPSAFRNNQSQASTDSSNKKGTLDATTFTISNSDADTDYNKAVTLVLERKQYDQAINAFQNFVKRYPDSNCQPNANYWLGQLNYNKGKKDEALYYFALVAKAYSKSPKTPDALLKVGVIMQEKGQKEKAQMIYQHVGKLYPNAEAAKQAQKRLATL